MIKCPVCSASQANNTIFCYDCGQYLVADDIRSTEPSSFMIDQQSIRMPTPRDTLWINKESSPPPGRHTSSAPVICLRIGARKREIKFRLNRSIYVGRVDPLHDTFPDVDLTEDEGRNKGVSRRHIRIFDREDLVLVEDLGSFNGTLLNGEKLPPFLPAPLSNGDLLQLGGLQIEVILVKPD